MGMQRWPGCINNAVDLNQIRHTKQKRLSWFKPDEEFSMTKTVQDMLAEARAAVPNITPQEAMKMSNDPNVVFVDLRDGTEVQASGKVKGAVHIPRGLLEFQADPASSSHAQALTPDKTIITYCAAGGRAALGGKTLKDMGYKNVMNMGGFAGWKDSGGEVE